MQKQKIPSNHVKRKRAPQFSHNRPLTPLEVDEILDEAGNAASIYVTAVCAASDPLACHARSFSNTRRTRLLKVQKMSLNRQNDYYRKLGYF